MDIENSKYVFFLSGNSIKQNGFDSYSKCPNDILAHYNIKYEELAENFKSPLQYNSEKWQSICSLFDGKINELERLLITPFEIYITAFLLAFNLKYEKAITLFMKCQALLPNSLYGQINIVFINLQIAQLYERLGLYKQSFSVLIRTRSTISKDKELFSYVHDFYASCCVSIGMLCFRYLGAPQLATTCFLTSALIRSYYEHTYMPCVYKHYISHAYRYASMMFCLPHERSYLFINASYKLRLELIQSHSDDVTREEMFYLEADFIFFLIRNLYKTGLINRHAKALIRQIAAMPPKQRKQLCPNIRNIALMLYRYYSIINREEKGWLWHRIMNYTLTLR